MAKRQRVVGPWGKPLEKLPTEKIEKLKVENKKNLRIE